MPENMLSPDELAMEVSSRAGTTPSIRSAHHTTLAGMGQSERGAFEQGEPPPVAAGSPRIDLRPTASIDAWEGIECARRQIRLLGSMSSHGGRRRSRRRVCVSLQRASGD
jgi:hypothetical protein